MTTVQRAGPCFYKPMGTEMLADPRGWVSSLDRPSRMASEGPGPQHFPQTGTPSARAGDMPFCGFSRSAGLCPNSPTAGPGPLPLGASARPGLRWEAHSLGLQEAGPHHSPLRSSLSPASYFRATGSDLFGGYSFGWS